MIVDHRVAGTRITVWDVLHHLEHGWAPEEIAEVLSVTDEQVRAAVDYIQAHQAEVAAVHRQIEERNVLGNPPHIQAQAEAARARRLAWLQERRKALRQA